MRRFLNRIPELVKEKCDRDNTKYQQKEIAEATGLTSAAISRIINTRHIDHLAYSSAYLIAEWLGVHVEDLSELEDNNE